MKTDEPELLTPGIPSAKKTSDKKPVAEKAGEMKTQVLPKTSTPIVGWTDDSSDWRAPPHASITAKAPAPKVLEAQNLDVFYGPNHILSGVSFNLYQGDTLGLLGLNGAGKSTLLKVLAGALAPHAGVVHIGENELYQNPISARMDIGYAPDKPAIYPEFRVIEFLKFIATMRRLPKAEMKNAIDDVIERCALTGVRRRIIGNLSTGFKQRVNLAQALIHSPRILILDEPATGLDPVQLIEMRELVSTLSADQATIFSSHDLHEVSSVCNRVLLINDGQSILDASLEQLSNANNVTIDLKLTNNADIDLANLPGVEAACRISAAHWLVTGNAMMKQHLETMLTVRGHTVISITETDNYLETVFRQLSTTHNNVKTDTSNTGIEL